MGGIGNDDCGEEVACGNEEGGGAGSEKESGRAKGCGEEVSCKNDRRELDRCKSDRGKNDRCENDGRREAHRCLSRRPCRLPDHRDDPNARRYLDDVCSRRCWD